MLPLPAHLRGRAHAAAARKQVWDTKQSASQDPVLTLTEASVEGPVQCMCWDAGSKLLAAAAAGEAVVW
jgi:hypothetical protein